MDYKDLKFEFRFLGYVKLPRQVEGYIKEIDLSFYRLKRNLEYEGKSLTPVCKTVKHTLLQDCVAFEKHIKQRMADFEELGVPDETVEPTCKELLGFLQSLGLKPSYGVLTEYDSLVDILNFMMELPISSKVEGFQGNHLE